jgi:capsular polysaccharide biosynthesis protein
MTGKELTLKDIYRILSRRIWLVVLLPLVTVIITAVLVYFVISPVYTATASMYVLNKQSTENAVNYSDLQSSTLLTADYREIILSKRVLRAVEKQGFDRKAVEGSDIEVTSANNTRIIEISVTSEDPVLAANLANAIGQEFSSTVVDIMDADNVNFVDVAEPPLEPSAPQKLQVIAMVGIVALLGSIVIALAREMMNTTLRTAEDVEKALGLTVLARIPKFEVK